MLGRLAVIPAVGAKCWFRFADAGGDKTSSLYEEYEYIVGPPFRTGWWPTRRLQVSSGSFVSSTHCNRDGRLPLGDQPIESDDCTLAALGGGEHDEEIGAAEFERVWTATLSRGQAEWEVFSGRYPVGKQTAGKLYMFHPHVITVDLGGDFLGVVNTREFARLVPFTQWSSGDELEALVTGFDNDNQWVLLEPTPGSAAQRRVATDKAS